MRALVTGATGFIGGQLARRLHDDGFEVRCLVRDRGSEAAEALAAARCELAVADLTATAGLAEALEGVEVAYFLVHMIDGGEDYPAIERAAAARFGRAASAAGVKRTVYLGGLGDESASRHLGARHQAAIALGEQGPPLTYFRAAMVIGPGSESYELLRGIVERLPALAAPDWLRTETQPIGADDVIDYLREAIDVPRAAGREIQIGGPRVLTHLELVEEMAAALGRTPPRQLPMPAEVARPATVAAGAAAVTPGTPEIASQISLGLTTPTVVTDPSAAELFSVRPKPLDAVLAASVDAVSAESAAP
ncbi:MAG: NmrA family NAD(P)-binding protein [Solirubrobacterales bacterium]